ncbi:hypothetical protein CC86DRAFT_464543 [Ophiobolus disseminans]|uniref:Uncharacterized protein n=1 Tax=Ophiobolus disseminans TaxID=1469910 RepID=A0A6A7AAB4_9PLEO|nr:hypothetical protein CC86DRAFT_464543 [Ophiobolus disseminans]
MEKVEAFCKPNFHWHVHEYLRYLEHRSTGGSEVHGPFLWQGINIFGERRTVEFSEDSRGSVHPQYLTFGLRTVLYSDRKNDEKRVCDLNVDKVRELEEDYHVFHDIFWDRLISALTRPDVAIGHAGMVIGIDTGCFHETGQQDEGANEDMNDECWNTNRVAFDIAQLFNDRAEPGHDTNLILEDVTHCDIGISCFKSVFESKSQGRTQVGFSGRRTTIDPGDFTRTHEIDTVIKEGDLNFLTQFGLAHIDENSFVIAVNTTFNLRQIFADFAKAMPNGGPVGILCRKIEGDGIEDVDDLDPSSINLLAYRERCVEIDIGDDTGLAIYLRRDEPRSNLAREPFISRTF